MASRIAARSTIAGTPVKSCISTRAGRKAISVLGSAWGSQPARVLMSAAVTVVPSSQRRRFSSRILSEKGSRDTLPPATEAMRKISYSRPTAEIVARAPKLSILKLLQGKTDERSPTRTPHEGC